MSPPRVAACPGPQRTLEALAQRLFCIAGTLAKYRDTGGSISAFEVRLLVTQLDTGAAEAERVAREIEEITDLIEDLAESDDRPNMTEALVRVRPPLTVINGGRR